MKSLTRFALTSWFVLSLLVYGSVLVSPKWVAYSALVSVGVPIIVVANLLLLIAAAVMKTTKAFYFLVLLLIAIPFINVGISFSGNDNLEEDGLKILNYNVKFFVDARKDNYTGVVSWINAEDPDIICFQEFHPQRGLVEKIKKNGNYEEAIFKDRPNLVIYSKYPILDKGLLLKDSELNNILYADINVNGDTIRVYSAHLESMGINPDKIQNPDGIRHEYESVKMKFLRASNSRTEQIDRMLVHAENSPYPVFIAGDFNDVPFSYNYFKIRRKYSNAFEKKGKGLGVTYNGKIPYLRIDNQFFSDRFKPKAFRTINNVYFSDHFPVIGIYEISR